jgi:hypothetical protein
VEEKTGIINYYGAKIGLPEVILVLILISKIFQNSCLDLIAQAYAILYQNAGNCKAEMFYLPELIPQFSVNGTGTTIDVFSPPEIITAQYNLWHMTSNTEHQEIQATCGIRDILILD